MIFILILIIFKIKAVIKNFYIENKKMHLDYFYKVIALTIIAYNKLILLKMRIFCLIPLIYIFSEENLKIKE